MDMEHLLTKCLLNLFRCREEAIRQYQEERRKRREKEEMTEKNFEMKFAKNMEFKEKQIHS